MSSSSSEKIDFTYVGVMIRFAPDIANMQAGDIVEYEEGGMT